MANTDKSSVMAKYIFDLLTTNKTLLTLQDVFYGRQEMIPRSPSLVVVPGPKRRELAGVAAPGGRTDNYMTTYLDVHSSKVGDESTERLKLDDLSDSIEKFLHADVQLGGLIIHGFVTDWDPGETFLQNGEFRTTRMTYVGRSKTYLSG